LSGSPDEPIAEVSNALGGIDGIPPRRVKHLHAPADELRQLEATIDRRLSGGQSTEWHEARREQLLRKIAGA
jgi:hypothetical protein